MQLCVHAGHACAYHDKNDARAQRVYFRLCASFRSPSRLNHARGVKRGGTAARKHARDTVDDAGLISDKHRDDMLLDPLIQRLGTVDVDVVESLRGPQTARTMFAP